MSGCRVCCLAAALVVATDASGRFSLGWVTLGGAVGVSSGAGFDLGVMLGVPLPTGELASERFAITGGYWQVPPAARSRTVHPRLRPVGIPAAPTATGPAAPAPLPGSDDPPGGAAAVIQGGAR